MSHTQQTADADQTIVYVEISGFTGSGKSAIYGEIEIALKAIGVTVQHADPVAARSEKNMTGADWLTALELYKPHVILSEVNIVRKR